MGSGELKVGKEESHQEPRFKHISREYQVHHLPLNPLNPS